jgi:hypothetical protein
VSWPPRVGEPLPRGAEAVGVRDKLRRYSLALGHKDGVRIHERRVVLVTTGWKLRYVGDRPRLVTAFIGDR